MDVRNITPSMKQQLMKMAGITDAKDFDELVERMAPAAMAAAASSKSSSESFSSGDDSSNWSLDTAAGMNNSSKILNGSKEYRTYPFQTHFVKILTLIEAAGIDRYSALNNDMAKQLEYVYSFLEDDEELKNLPLNVIPPEENQPRDGSTPSETCLDRAEKSKMLRDRGNKSYSKKEMHAALAFYSQAIVAAPLNSRETALAIGNRSATFFEMGEWKKCLDDIDALLEFYEYPKEMHYKIYDRKGRSLLELSKLESKNNPLARQRAKEALNEAIETVKESKLSNPKQEQFIIETKKMIELTESESAKNSTLNQKLESTKDKNKPSSHVKEKVEMSETDEHKENPWLCPFKIWEKNSAFPVLADALEITYDDEVGRHVKATRNIMAGEAINEEEAIAAHLSPYKMRTNCVHCFRKTGSSVYPSPLNSKARFCCMYCLRTAMNRYHRFESRADIIDLFYTYSQEEDDSSGSGCIPLAYRAVTQKGLKFFLDNRSKLFTEHNIKFGTNVESGYSYTGDEHYRGLYNLVNHLEKMTPNERLSFSIRSVVLLKCLKASGFFPSSTDISSRQNKEKEEKNDSSKNLLSENESYIAQLLFHFQTGIQYNLHAIYQVDGALEGGKKIPLLDIGAGVYPTTLFFNHSCSPNTLRINQGTRVIFIAKRNIKKGEEVTECYGIHHLSMDKQARQEKLKRGYAFDCACQACVEDYPTLVSGKLPGAISPSVAQKLGNSLSRYKKYFDEGKLEKSFEVCREYLNRLDELKVKYPHRNYEIATIALCSSLWGMTQAC